MAWDKHDYDDIPGTYVFDGKHAHDSYPLNKLLFSFCEEANRNEFDKDPAAYCDKYGVTGKYKEFVVKQDFLGMLRSGAASARSSRCASCSATRTSGWPRWPSRAAPRCRIAAQRCPALPHRSFRPSC